MKHFKWDYYSDQPEVIKDKAFKQSIYKASRRDSLKMLAINLLVFPVSFLFYLIFPAKKIHVDTSDFFGMSINLDKNPQQSRALIDELQVNNLLIRVPLSDIQNLPAYVSFASDYKDKNLLVNILQDRRHIEDLALLKQSLEQIFEAFSPLTKRFQIGNAINRKKWGFFSMDEYLAFFKVAHDLKKQRFPELLLLGSSIIDFEYYFTIRTLFNRYKIYFDQCSSLLYVDRRGAPENPQMGLNLIGKLQFLQSILRLSPKSGKQIIITETNWPISHTAPYAPTSEKECVSLDDHASFLVRYYLLALASGVARQVYWHQLIAPGYGLIDNREGELIRYPAFFAFKNMLQQLQHMSFVSINKHSDYYSVLFQHNNSERTLKVCWSLDSAVINTQNRQIISRDGKRLKAANTTRIGHAPIYLLAD